MDQSPAEDPVRQFISFTGSGNEPEARQLLEACNGDIAMAVDLYFQQHQGVPTPPPSSSGPSSSEAGTSRQKAPRRSPRFPGAFSARPRPLIANGSASISPSKHVKNNDADEDVCMIDESDSVRAPIAPVRGAIIEQTFTQQYQGRRRRTAISAFDSYRDFRAEAEEQLASLQNGATSANDGANTATRRTTLQALFRPPIEIIHRGDWESARAEAERVNSWLLVNVQDVQEFACQTLNRDVWANAAVKELIRSNFLFWQIYHDSADGARIGNYYRIQTYPAIFVVDPRTGELLTHLRAQDAVSFCDQVTTFLDTFPDFAARDRHLVGAAAPAPSAEPTPSASAAPQLSNHQGDGVAASSSGGMSRKRNLPDEDPVPSAMESVSSPKKVKIGEDMPEIDALVNGGNKLTTVDRDEWRSLLGAPDGCGALISLMLRLPDGSRKSVHVEDTTPLKAIFVLTAGLGYRSNDHLLVMFYPKREYSLEHADHTLRQLAFNRQELIHVERK